VVVSIWALSRGTSAWRLPQMTAPEVSRYRGWCVDIYPTRTDLPILPHFEYLGDPRGERRHRG